MLKQTLIILAVLILAGVGRSASAQSAYPSDYYGAAENNSVYWPVEHDPLDLRVTRLPSLDDVPSLGLPLEMPDQPTPAPDDQQPPAAEPSATEPEVEAVEILEVAKKPPPKIKLWKGGCELGFNGSEGNTETLDFRFGFDAKRKTDVNIFDVDLDYHKKTADDKETANRLFLDSRYEWLQGDSSWTSFVHQTTEYDEFKAYNVRVTLDTGIGYQFIDNEATTLMGRFGSGVSHEIGGPDKQVVPELNWGLELERQLTERQKFKASAEFVPDVTDFADYRVNTKLDWEVLLDEDWNLSLKFGILDRYDSTPNGSKPNDLDYSITLLWSF